MPVYPSYDFIDVLEPEGSRAVAAERTSHEHPRRRARRPPERRQVGAVQPHRRAPTPPSCREEAGTTRDRHFARAEWNGPTVLARRHGRPHRRPALADGPRDPPPGGGGDRRGRPAAVRASTPRPGCTPATRASPSCCAKSGKPWMLVANKVDDPRATDYYEFYELGAGEPVPVSALNGKSSGDLLDVHGDAPPAAPTRPRTTRLRVAVIGRPNVGKSSLVNRLLGEERLVVSDERGHDARRHRHADARTTGATFVFVDTAGLRRQTQDRGRHRVLLVAAHAAARSSAPTSACCMIDAAEGLHNQDLKIADAGLGSRARPDHRRQQVGPGREGRQGDGEVREGVPREGAVPHVRAVPVHVGAHRPARHSGCSTCCSRWTRSAQAHHDVAGERARCRSCWRGCQPPQAAGLEVKLNYATQVEIAPPTIAVFGNHPDLVRGALRPLPAQRLPRVLGIHGQPAAHRDAAQERS